MNNTITWGLLCFCLLFTACTNKEQNGSEPITDKYAIHTDGKTLTTVGLQKAIDDCAGQGGGTVSLPAGKYLTGTLVLKKNVTLNLEKGATILGSKNIADYPDKGRRKALVFAERADNISITGEGEINGNGAAFNQGNDAPNRPTLVLLLDCNKVNVNGVKLSNSGFWTFRFVRCDGVDINKVYVEGHANWNNDGFDIESRNVTITDCVIDTDDDAICFKSEDPDYVVENITVKNCDLSSNCNFIKFGTASAGGFRNIRVSDCILHKCRMYRFTKKPEYLEQAIKIAEFVLNHSNMPKDLIPYWDYNAPDIPDALRDASAAAINCSGLLELSQYVSGDKAKKYYKAAEKMLQTLSSPVYTAEVGTNGGFILKHSVGNIPSGTEVDVPLTYADYYYVEALCRYKSLVDKP